MKGKIILRELAILSIMISSLYTSPILGARPASGQVQTPPQSPSADFNLHLPIIFNRFPPPAPIFGVEPIQLSTTKLAQLEQANAYWVRYFTFSWEDIEPVYAVPAQYHWDSVEEAGLQEAAARGLKVIAIIRFTPGWAQKIPPYACGPVAAAHLGRFADFVRAAVARYSAAPYNIKHWEIGNEVDVDPIWVDPHSIIGCWGDDDDDYYGGGYYAQMLHWVYPAMKAADPGSKLLIGGLLLDCDPTYPPPPGTASCKPAKFLEGILRNGGAASFDIVSFHGYAYYTSNPTQPIVDETHPGWNERGGVILGKIDFLREVMAAYGVNKPLMITESSLICPEWSSVCTPPGTAFYEAQADYVVTLYARTWAANILGTVWYALDNEGWRYCSLYNGATPKPAFYAYQFMSQELAGTVIGGAVTSFSGVTGYEFFGQGERIWVLWAPDRLNHTITLPAGATQVLDKYGNTITPVGGQVTVNSPIYIEFSS